jgi:anthranilate phosphoribosyltransferase
MSLVPYLQIVAKGQERGRSLTLNEAQLAMEEMLNRTTAPETLGAFLMVLRFRGETADEIAGFTSALRRSTEWMHGQFDLDWPSYAAGRTRGAPLFLLAARLVAQAGYRVVLHGRNSHQAGHASVRAVISQLGIEENDPDAGLCYFPLEDLSAPAFDLLNLRDKFGLRSCINTVLRMWNPSDAAATVQGVFHPSYRGLQTRAAESLGQKTLTVIKGGGGEFERNPSKEMAQLALIMRAVRSVGFLRRRRVSRGEFGVLE